VLAGYFAQVTQVHVHVPHHFQSQLLAFLLIVHRRPPNDAVQLLHEESPVASLEHPEPTVFKCLRHLPLRLLLKGYHEVLFYFAEVLYFVELKFFRRQAQFKLRALVGSRLENPSEPGYLLHLVCRAARKYGDSLLHEFGVYQHLFQNTVQFFAVLQLFAACICKQKLLFQRLDFCLRES